jgi:hypothetical protein
MPRQMACLKKMATVKDAVATNQTVRAMLSSLARMSPLSVLEFYVELIV